MLASGAHYVNSHTPANPAGKPRGQIELLSTAFIQINKGLLMQTLLVFEQSST